MSSIKLLLFDKNLITESEFDWNKFKKISGINSECFFKTLRNILSKKVYLFFYF